ncbi:MAG: TRAP transporter substrate-binding protein [Deltaproteobacteria bacterium]|nr:TRAP transporter substrate-binding protein [Deltaproteobacteria bacterium]
MMKRFGSTVIVMFIISIFFLGTFSDAHAKESKPVVLNFNHLFPEVAWINTNVVIPWKEMVEQKSNGRLKINIYTGGALAKPGTMYDAVKAGSIDICLDPGPYYMGVFPMSEGTQLPFLGAKSSRAASLAWMRLYREFPEMRKEYDETHMLWLFSQGPGQINSRKPVRTMEDMKGLIIRAPGGIGNNIRALGGSPVSMPSSECYIALSKGTVDGTIFPTEAMRTHKIYEVTDYITMVDLYVQWFWVCMNKKKYESMPQDLQKIIDECSGEKAADLTGREWNKADKEGLELALKEGMEIIELAPEEFERWKKQCEPVKIKWIEDMEAKGYPAKRFVEAAEKYISEFNNEFGSWRD